MTNLLRMLGMRYFTTGAAFKPMPDHKITYLWGVKYTSKGPQDVKVGACWHRWETRKTHWLVWSVRRCDNAWLSGEQERLYAEQ